MAAAASQLCVRQASTLLDCFIHHKGCKLEQISPLFHLYLYLFFTYISTSFSPISLALFQVQKSIVLFYANLACRFVVAFKFIYFKYICTRERLLLAKSAKQSEGKGVSRSQLQCQASTALRKNSVHLNRARVIEINV